MLSIRAVQMPSMNTGSCSTSKGTTSARLSTSPAKSSIPAATNTGASSTSASAIGAAMLAIPSTSWGMISGRAVVTWLKAPTRASISPGAASATWAANAGRTAVACEASKGSEAVSVPMLAITPLAIFWIPSFPCKADVPSESSSFDAALTVPAAFPKPFAIALAVFPMVSNTDDALLPSSAVLAMAPFAVSSDFDAAFPISPREEVICEAAFLTASAAPATPLSAAKAVARAPICRFVAVAMDARAAS